MSQEMVRLTPNRPAFLNFENTRIFVSAHDEGYRIRKREFKRRIKELHPDLNAKTVVVHIPEGPRDTSAHWSVNHQGEPRWIPAFTSHVPAPYTITRVVKAQGPVRRVIKAYTKFLEEEKQWYAQYGLEPPRD